jgi:hypothetical protein
VGRAKGTRPCASASPSEDRPLTLGRRDLERVRAGGSSGPSASPQAAVTRSFTRPRRGREYVAARGVEAVTEPGSLGHLDEAGDRGEARHGVEYEARRQLRDYEPGVQMLSETERRVSG